MTLRDDTSRRLHRIVLDRQRDGRLPGVFAGVARDGGAGVAGRRRRRVARRPGHPADDDHQFLVASNTKTFTAAMVMQLRDEGRLSLDDTLDVLVPEAPRRA